ncbi:MAG: YfhO family protein [Planctomycetota bacterium]|jgi:hypothetical protein
MTESAPQRTSAAREAVAVLALTLLCCLFFWKAVTLQGVFFHYDHAIQNYPYRQFFAEGLRQGQLRLWTSDIFCGFPLFAESQGNSLYPLFLILFRVFDPWIAYNYYTVLHFLMAGLFAYVLARVMHVGRGGAVLAGICYMLAAPVLNHAHHTNIVVAMSWLPLLLALMELFFRRRSLPLLLGFAAATAALVLGAQPQYALYCALVCGLYLLWRLRLVEVTGGRAWTVAKLMVAVGAAAVLGGLLAAAQVLPLLELVTHSGRAGASVALPSVSPGVPGNLMTLLLPHYFGSPGLGSYWGDVDVGLYAELTLFVGVVPLMLALVGACTDRRRAALFFAGLGMFAFLFSLGFSGSLYNAFALLPVFRTARYPSRFAFVTALCVAMLAGMGVERLLAAAGKPRTRKAAIGAAAVILFLSALCLMLADAANARLASLSPSGLAAALPLGQSQIEAVWRHLHRTLPADIWRLVLVAVGGSIALLICARRRVALPAAFTAGLWCVLAFAELSFAGHEFNAVTDPAVYQTPPPLAKALHDLPPGRILRYRYHDRLHDDPRMGLYPFTRGWALRPDLFANSLDRLPHNANMLWGIRSVNGFSPLQTRALKTAMGEPRTLSTLIEPHLDPILNLLGARYILTPRDELPGDYVHLRKVGDIHIFESLDALPRTFIVHSAQAALSDEAAAAALMAEDFDYRGRLLVHDSSAPLVDLQPGRADIGELAWVLADVHDAVAVQANLTRPGYLVLADQHYPGWRVTVDGQEAELLRVDYLYKGVRLDEGLHRVVFAFCPRSVLIGIAISVASLGILAIGLVFSLIRGPRMPGLREPEGEQLLDQPYSPRTPRLLVLTSLVFLLLGPALYPLQWRVAPSQLDPRRYAVHNAIASAYYCAADGDYVRGHALLRDTSRWWPEDYAARDHVARFGSAAVRALLRRGRYEEARAIARDVVEFAPDRARVRASALARLAQEPPEDQPE